MGVFTFGAVSVGKRPLKLTEWNMVWQVAKNKDFISLLFDEQIASIESIWWINCFDWIHLLSEIVSKFYFAMKKKETEKCHRQISRDT